MRFKKLRIGIDVDDVLYKCSEYAVEIVNDLHLYDTPLSINELTDWGKTGGRGDVIFPFFEDPTFYESQPMIDGAKEFIHELSKRAEVFFVTAVYPQAMTIRALRLQQDFPEIPKENLIIGSRKDLIPLDMILDDGAHNLFRSTSTYPVLMRKPWNQHVTGCLAVNNYEEFLNIVDSIQSGPVSSASGLKFKNKIFVFVGPSGSGKTAIMDKMIEKNLAVKALSYTSREPRSTGDSDYYFISMDKFLEMEADGQFLESSRYAGSAYGTTYEEVRNRLAECEGSKKHVITAMDISGALNVKQYFGEQAVLVYVDRKQANLLASIIDRPVSTDEKVKRILSLTDEKKNEAFCDVTFHNDVPLDSKEMKEKIKKLISY